MNLTVQIKLLPSKEQEQWLTTAATEYISLVNDIVDYALGQGMVPKFSSGDVAAPLPAAVKNQAIRDARSIYRKCCKTHIQHTLRKPIILGKINPQSKRTDASMKKHGHYCKICGE